MPSIAPRQKPKVGQVFYIHVKVTNGMFPSEKYFYFELEPGKPIAGYVPAESIQGDELQAVLVEWDADKGEATLALPGELSRNNLIRVPAALLQQFQSA